MTITELNKNLKSVNKELLKAEAVNKNSKHLADLNRTQLKQGKTEKNAAIRPSYSPKYAASKQQMGSMAPFGTPDLLLSGAFQKDIDYVAEGDQYYPESWDEKTPFLVNRYKDILGLTKDSKNKAMPIVTKTFINLWKRKVGLS